MTIHTLIDALRNLLIFIPAILFTITIHEFFQGLMALKKGDVSLKDSGELKFNPFNFIDNFGLICFVLFQYGWAKSITIDTRNFKKQKLDYITVITTGMAANLIAAFIFILLIILYKPNPKGYIYYLFFASTQINLKYFFINFFPFLPFAGGKIIAIFYPKYNKFEFIGIIILLILLVFNFIRVIDIIVEKLINIFI